MLKPIVCVFSTVVDETCVFICIKTEQQSTKIIYVTNFQNMAPDVDFSKILTSYPSSYELLIKMNFHLILLQVYVLKRPHVDEFLQRVGQLYECVLFTASLAKVTW